MPVYEYRCQPCGPFDQRRGVAEATAPASCPTCAQPAARAYTPPGGRRAGGVLTGAGRSERARIDRARSGEPTVTGPPTGRRRSTPHAH